MEMRPKQSPGRLRKPVTQKALAQHLGLHPSTVSLVLNDAPLAAGIRKETRERILRAARELDYRPNLNARSLSSNRSSTVAILLPAIDEGYTASLLGGIDQTLFEASYSLFLAIHHGNKKIIGEYPRRLAQRVVEGFILLNTPIEKPLDAPAVAIGGFPAVGMMSRVLLDNRLGARLAVEHLIGLGHRRFAVMKGHAWRPASEERWQGITETLRAHGIELNKELVYQFGSPGKQQIAIAPEEGYVAAKALLRSGVPFTALLAFNDLTALGAMRAFHETGLHVPNDLSVVGFDDIPSAAYHLPGLTTLRQPLQVMGRIAGSLLLELIRNRDAKAQDVLVAPELVVRETTRPV